MSKRNNSSWGKIYMHKLSSILSCLCERKSLAMKMITWSSTALPALEHNAMLWNMMPRQKQKFVQILTINLSLKLYFFFIADYRQWAEQCIIQNIVCAVFSVFQRHHKKLSITYQRDVERGYVFFFYIALLNLNIAQTTQAHTVTLHILISF